VLKEIMKHLSRGILPIGKVAKEFTCGCASRRDDYMYEALLSCYRLTSIPPRRQLELLIREYMAVAPILCLEQGHGWW
jgi:hypothetical protein